MAFERKAGGHPFPIGNDIHARHRAPYVKVAIVAIASVCQSALDRDPRSASKRDPLVLRFERLALAPSELAGIAETMIEVRS